MIVSEGKWAIDRVLCGEENGHIMINLRGWCVMRESDAYALEFDIDGEKSPVKSVTRISRKDVVNSLAPRYQVKETEGAGFVLTVEFEKPELKKELCLRAVCGEEALTLYRCSREELLRQMKESGVAYAFDKIDLDQGKILLDGWAVALTGKELEYEIKDGAGKKLEAKVRRTVRPDINRMYFGEPYRCMAGFTLEFSDVDTPEFVFEAGDGTNHLKVTISRKDIIKEAKKKKKKYVGVKEILKTTTWKNVGADFRILFGKGPAALRREWDDRYTNEFHQYDKWIRRQVPDEKELLEQRKTKFPRMPKISIVVPAYHTPELFLKQMVDSVKKQSYENWELCIADGGADDTSVERLMQAIVREEPRIRYKKLEKNEGISGNTNEALKLATGEFIGLLDHDDILTCDALYEVVRAVNENPGVKVFYTDEDKVSKNLDLFYDPHFKSDFNRNLLRSNNYICHFFVASRALIDQVGVFDPEYDGSQDYDFILRCTEASEKVVHIPKVLYHWRVHNASTAANSENKMYCFEAGRKAIGAHLKRCGLSGTVEIFPEHLGYYRVTYDRKDSPLVSVIIPNKDEKESLELCIRSVLDKTTYENYEIIVVENNSTTEEIRDYYKELEREEKVKVVYWNKGFNYSAINNFGVAQSAGAYLLFLNNDTEVLEGDWMQRMVADCARENIGITGVKLCYPDMTMQHCGVMLGLGGVAGHIFTGYTNEYMGCFGRAQIQQNVSAVTAACMMVRRTVYEEVKGFEEDLAVAFNDVDFCMKVRQHGYEILYEPLVCLKHYESKSRGKEDTPEKQIRFQREVDYMQEKWGEILKKGDPYYPRNLLMEIGR